MKVEIINIGDELLIGQVINTNASWMSQQLSFSGFDVCRVVVIPDKREDILDALNSATSRADIILLSGGLGPTRDDITKYTLCEYFNTRLVFHEESYKNIERIFAARGMAVSELNRQQAEVPEKCIPILNVQGTAPGMLFEQNGKIFISLPGVPFEMKKLMSDYVIPELSTRFNLPAIIHHTINTEGIAESTLADTIKEWELSLPGHMHLAYLPSPGIVRLRITGVGPDKEVLITEIASFEEKLGKIIPEYIYSYNDEALEEVLGKALLNKGYSLCTAESCTGGYIAHRITSVPGSSRYFKGSVVAYSNEIKNSVLDIPLEILEKHGAVSREVVSLMAENARKLLKSDVAVAVSGIAGPDGGTPEKPVGTVWAAVSSPKGTFEKKFLFGDNRERNIVRTGNSALHLILKNI